VTKKAGGCRDGLGKKSRRAENRWRKRKDEERREEVDKQEKGNEKKRGGQNGRGEQKKKRERTINTKYGNRSNCASVYRALSFPSLHLSLVPLFVEPATCLHPSYCAPAARHALKAPRRSHPQLHADDALRKGGRDNRAAQQKGVRYWQTKKQKARSKGSTGAAG